MPSVLGELDTPQARGLLSTLADFVKPIVYECMSSTDTIRDSELEPQSLWTCEGSMEHKLVYSLKAFIEDIVDSCQKTTLRSSNLRASNAPISEDLVRCQSNVNHECAESIRTLNPAVQDKILQKIHKTMIKIPTRLLAFNSAGGQVRIVDNWQAVNHLEVEVLAAAENSQELQAKLDFISSERQYNLLAGLVEEDKIIDDFIEEHTGYSILSHTWTSHEVTFQDGVRKQENLEKNFKIRNFCRVSAQKYGRFLGWIDTCCINKESSSELDEAIRSMYTWYRNAAECVIYLSETNDLEHVLLDSWFTRGWTLQELVAPRRIEVYNKRWNSMASHELHDKVAEAAWITPEEMRLFRQGSPKSIPISRRLQMASHRKVTREEDSAYSLMGLLDVSIATAYGEGAEHAFTRLMREIVKTKRHVLDIFNHSYEFSYDSVLPNTVKAYRVRSERFDISSPDEIRSKLDYSVPVEPLLLTHIELRVPLLLIPGLYITTSDHGFKAKGFLYGEAYGYNLLDSRLFSEKRPPSSAQTRNHASLPEMIFFGVVNFAITGNEVLLINSCLSIPLYSESSIPGQVKSSEHLHIQSLSSPRRIPVFTVFSSRDPDKKEPDKITVPKQDLEFHGLQILTMYL